MIETSQPGPAAERGYPFWTYLDVLLFFLAMLPSGVLAYGSLWAVKRISGAAAWPKAVDLLSLQFVTYLLWFLALSALFKLKYDRDFWQSLRWNASVDAIGTWTMLGPALAFAVGLAGSALDTPKIRTPMEELLDERTSLVLVGVFASTLGPLSEELAFRGFLQPIVTRSLGPVAGIVIPAALFAVPHLPQYAWSWRHITLIGLAGVAFGWARFRSGSTAAATGFHATYNLTFVLLYAFRGDTFPP